MFLKIDYREKKLIPILTKMVNDDTSLSDKLEIKIENLLIGDIAFSSNDNDNKNLILFERKTLNDLESSIKDNRYKEQCLRMQIDELHNHNIIFIIEGNIPTYAQFKNPSTLYSAVFSLYYYQGFSCLFSQGLNDTSTIIYHFLKKIIREKDNRLPFYKNIIISENNNQSNNNSETISIEQQNILNNDYSQCIKKQKHENINKSNIWVFMLMQIPYISSTIAKSIIEKYENIPNLIMALNSDMDCLNQFYIFDGKGNKRKLSSKVIENIKKLIL